MRLEMVSYDARLVNSRLRSEATCFAEGGFEGEKAVGFLS